MDKKTKKLFRRSRGKGSLYPFMAYGRVDRPGYLCGFRLTIPLFDKEEDWVVDGKFFSQAQEKKEENV